MTPVDINNVCQGIDDSIIKAPATAIRLSATAPNVMDMLSMSSFVRLNAFNVPIAATNDTRVTIMTPIADAIAKRPVSDCTNG